MKSKKMRVAVYIMAVLPLVVYLLMYSKVPAQVPMQWSLDGGVRYGSKVSFFMVPALCIGLALMFDIMPYIDPRKRNYAKFGPYYDGFCLFLMIFMDAMFTITMIETFRPDTISVDKFVPILVGLLFMFLGNMLPKVKSNFYMGIRTSWALSDNDVWNRTNRLGGILMFCSGLIILIGSFILPPTWEFTLMMVLVFGSTGLPGVMSFIWYQRKHKNQESEDSE